MPKITMYDLSGKKMKDVEISAEVFGIVPNQQTLYDSVVMQQASLRQGTHKTKTRSEVRGGGRKPWRQKGTGRARQGSIRSPQWRGGGTVFGPTPRKYGYTLNRKVRKLALKSALSAKVLEDKAMIVNNLEMSEIKTQAFVKVMKDLKLNTAKTLFVIAIDEKWENAYMSMRNIQNVNIVTVEGLNVFDILHAEHLVLTEQAAKLAGEVLV